MKSRAGPRGPGPSEAEGTRNDAKEDKDDATADLSAEASRRRMKA